jgi:eukaryotic-like serine/threonine-protein kinase
MDVIEKKEINPPFPGNGSAKGKQAPLLEPGTVLQDRWIVLESIGRGGMGEVYLAHQLNLKRDVAVKVISAAWFRDIEHDEYEAQACMERFQREMQIMAQVRHPNVLQIYDCGTIRLENTDSMPAEYIVMEYVPGATLRDSMSEDGFYPDEKAVRDWIFRYFLSLLDGVEALHAAGIVHRDLKPENVLLDGHKPKITDFGLARSCRLKPVTQSLDVKGTPPYMSPEHFMDLRRTDSRTDVYSLGKILYEATEGKIGSGQIPFKTVSLKKAETPFFAKLNRIIEDATREDKEKRTASVSALRQELESLREAKKGRMPSRDIRHAKNRGYGKWISFSALLLIVLATVIGTANYLQPFRPEQGKEALRSREAAGPLHSDSMNLIPPGELVLPENYGPEAGKVVGVKSFYLDETPVTNYSFVEFLNEEIGRIQVENGLVKGDGEIWLLLGEAMKGYEPILFQDGKFHVTSGSHAACPVIRVTAYGASAFARHHGKRLMTEYEWLYVLLEGENSQNLRQSSADVAMTGKDEEAAPGSEAGSPPQSSPVAPVLLFEPNAFGIRGINDNIAEWGMSGAVRAEGETEYVIMGGPYSGSDPSTLKRFPWEASLAVGFRIAADTES